MTSSRYLAVLPCASRDADPLVIRAVLGRVAAGMKPASGSDRLIDFAGGAVMVPGQEPIRLGTAGLIVGRLYDRETMQQVVRLSAAEIDAILNQGAQRLVDRYWGPWMAFIERPDHGWQVTRAPLCELPCYHVEAGEHQIFGSDVELISATGLYDPQVDWDEVRLQLMLGEMLRRSTCLHGLSELVGGNSLECNGDRLAERTLWTPWSFAAAAKRIEDRAEAVSRLRLAISECVAARSADFDRIVLLLSGGLDSSIVAAALHRAKCDVTALNLVTTSASGNELEHARRVSDWLGMPLRERVRDVARIDVTHSAASGLPRPSVRIFRQESLRIADETASKLGAAAVFDGGGGDNVFCSLKTAASVADRLLTSGPGTAALRTALDVSRFAPAGLGAVFADALRRIVRRNRAARPQPDQTLLRTMADAQCAEDIRHPWLAVPPGALPGSAGHVWALTLAQMPLESGDPRAQTSRISPLMAQPVVETCLQIPSWNWMEDGRSRAIARRAFADTLPIETVMRRSKGTPNSFSVEIIDVHRRSIRELLTNGLLAKRGIVDISRVLALLDDPTPLRSEMVQRILQLVDCEVWARSWGSGST